MLWERRVNGYQWNASKNVISNVCASYGTEATKRNTRVFRYQNRRLSRGRACTLAKIQYKKKKSFSFQGLTFARHGDKLSMDFGSAANGESIPSSFSTVISAKVRETQPGFYLFFLLLEVKCQHRSIVFSCLAGRIFVRFRSRFLARLIRSCMGNVRPFCAWNLSRA